MVNSNQFIRCRGQPMYLLVCFYIFVTALTFLFTAYVVYSVWKKITYIRAGRADLGTGHKSDSSRIRL